MEPPEVSEGAYVVFDRFGHEATLGIERWDVIFKAWSEESYPERLRAWLSEFLAIEGHPLGDDAELEDLVWEAYRVAREAELARTPRVLVPLIRWMRRRRAEKYGDDRLT